LLSHIKPTIERAGFLVMTLIILSLLPNVVNAAPVLIQNQKGGICSSGTCSITFGSSVSLGNLLLIEFSGNTQTSTCAVFSNPTDTRGSILTINEFDSVVSGSTCDEVFFVSGLAGGSGTDTVSVSYSTATIKTTNMWYFEVNQLGSSPQVSLSSGAACNLSTGNLSYNSVNFLAELFVQEGAGGKTYTSGFTVNPGGSDTFNGAYLVSTSSSGSTNFPITCNNLNNNWVEISAIFTLSSSTTTSTVTSISTATSTVTATQTVTQTNTVTTPTTITLTTTSPTTTTQTVTATATITAISTATIPTTITSTTTSPTTTTQTSTITKTSTVTTPTTTTVTSIFTSPTTITTTTTSITTLTTPTTITQTTTVTTPTTVTSTTTSPTTTTQVVVILVPTAVTQITTQTNVPSTVTATEVMAVVVTTTSIPQKDFVPTQLGIPISVGIILIAVVTGTLGYRNRIKRS